MFQNIATANGPLPLVGGEPQKWQRLTRLTALQVQRPGREGETGLLPIRVEPETGRHLASGQKLHI